MEGGDRVTMHAKQPGQRSKPRRASKPRRERDPAASQERRPLHFIDLTTVAMTHFSSRGTEERARGYANFKKPNQKELLSLSP